MKRTKSFKEEFEQASNLEQACLCRHRSKNAYIIDPKFQIGETVEIINPPYINVKRFEVNTISPRIKKSGIEIWYESKSWVHCYRESQLKKVED